jgi:GH24 family phage-related lysozyme (muramidase)
MNIKQYVFLFVIFIAGCSSTSNLSYNKAAAARAKCYSKAAEQILRWDKVKGKSVKGLSLRRQKEYKLFMSGCDEHAQTINSS